jgi:hypothetical protein
MTIPRQSSGESATPDVTVALIVGARPLRVRWALNALEQQTPAAHRWEVVVALREDDREALEAIRDHPLVLAGRARCVFVPATATPGALRNAAWRNARGASVAFVDTELRPPPDWLEHATAGDLPEPEAVLEGSIQPDPTEGTLMRAAFRFTRTSTPPAVFPPAANVVYPRQLLERVDGWDERLASEVLAGVDLAARARRAGARWRVDSSLIAYAAVRPLTPLRHVRLHLPLRDLPWSLRQYPELRARLPLRVLRRRSHLAMAVAVIGVAAARRHPQASLLTLPWLAATARGVPSTRLPSEISRRAAEDLGEIALLAWGSVRHRALLL